jgi:hypothetical protein
MLGVIEQSLPWHRSIIAEFEPETAQKMLLVGSTGPKIGRDRMDQMPLS